MRTRALCQCARTGCSAASFHHLNGTCFAIVWPQVQRLPCCCTTLLLMTTQTPGEWVADASSSGVCLQLQDAADATQAASVLAARLLMLLLFTCAPGRAACWA